MRVNWGSNDTSTPVGQPPARWSAASRRTIGAVGLVAAVVIAIVAAGVMVAGKLGAAGDGFQRIQIACGLLVAAGLVTAVVGFSDWSLRTVLRSPASWAGSVLFAAVILWAAFGIDSTRAVRALPEADLSHPGATEVRRWAAPAEGSFLGVGVASASLTRDFVTTNDSSEIEAFYASKLAAAGWKGPSDFGVSIGIGGFIQWQRDQFLFQLYLPKKPDVSGRFSVTIFGPPQ